MNSFQENVLPFLLRKLRESENICGNFKLSLTTTAVCNLNDFLSGLDYEDVASSTGNKFLEEASFLKDVISKIVALKIIHGLQTLQGQLDLSVFTSLKFLELKRVPAHLIKGLKELFSILEVLHCNRSISSLRELFGNFSHEDEVSCPNLKDLDLSYNYIEELDDTLKLLPNLEYFDVSHNTLKSVLGVQGLHALVVVNLNYNELDQVPPFSPQIVPSLKILLMRNNILEKLSGLEKLTNLEELDVSYNCLSEYSILSCLEALSCLKKLCIKNNPLSFHSKHRLLVSQYLHPNTINNGLQLNCKPLTKVETEVISSAWYKTNCPLPTAVKLDISSINVVSDDVTHEVSSLSSINSCVTDSEKNVRTRSKKKYRRVREAEIIDSVETLDTRYGEEPCKTLLEDSNKDPSSGLSHTSQTPNATTHLPSVELKCGSCEPPIISAPCPPRLSEVKAETHKIGDHYTMHSSLKECHSSIEQESNRSSENIQCRLSEPSDLRRHFEANNGFLSYPCGDMDVFPIEPARKKSVSSTSSEEVEWDDIDIDGDENTLFLVERKQKDKTLTLFISIGVQYLTEKDGLTGQYLDALDLRTLQSVKKTYIDQENYEVHISFDAIKLSRRERIYCVNNSETASEIVTLLESFLEKSLKNKIVDKLQCLKCGAEFLKEAAHVKTFKQEEVSTRNWAASTGFTKEVEEIDNCPQCGSSTVIDASDVSTDLAGVDMFSQSSSSSPGLLAGFISRVKSSPLLSRSPMSSLLNTSSSFKKDEFSVNDSSMKSSSHKSVFSQESVMETFGQKGSELDSSKKGNLNKILSPEEFGGADSADDNSFVDLLEESNNNQAEDRAKNVSSYPDHGDENLSLQSLLSEREIITKETFSEVDHRLKLYLQIDLLQYDEQLCGVLKAVVISSVAGNFKGILVLSSKRLYFMKADSKFGLDQVEKCFQCVESKLLDHLKAIRLLLGHQGFTVIWGGERAASSTCILKDADYCTAFVALVIDTVRQKLHDLDIPLHESLPEDSLVSIIRSALQDQCDEDISEVPNSCEVLLFILVDWAEIERGDDSLTPIAVIATKSDLFIVSVEYLRPASQSSWQPEVCYKLKAQQKITNLTCMHLSESYTTAGMHFVDNENEADHCWLIDAETKSSIFSLIKVLKDPWEDSFGIDFPVAFCRNCKCVQFYRD